MSRGSIGRDQTFAEVAVELELRDLGLVGLPLGPLVADEPLEDVLAERLGHELGALHLSDGFGQRRRQRSMPSASRSSSDSS